VCPHAFIEDVSHILPSAVRDLQKKKSKKININKYMLMQDAVIVMVMVMVMVMVTDSADSGREKTWKKGACM
jgi:hypothetical protein